jgi:hypothetical protein
MHPNILIGGLLLASLATLFVCERIGERALRYAVVGYGCLWCGLACLALVFGGQ